MKKILLLLALWVGIRESYAQNGFTVRVKLNNPENYKVFLGHSENKKFVADTNYAVVDGWYVFKGSVQEPVIANLSTMRNPNSVIKNGKGYIPGPTLMFALSNDVITITGDANSIYMSEVKGGKANAEWDRIKAKENATTDEMWKLNKKRYALLENDHDTVAFRRAGELLTPMAKESMERKKQFIKDNPTSFVSAYFLSGMINIMTLEELKAAYMQLQGDAKNNQYTKRIADKVENAEATAIGRSAVAIDKKDINGNNVNLQTLKGKYVLLDFWGSWCMPCRMSHPHLKEVYTKYKDSGFEIVGIAEEHNSTPQDNRKSWKEAIEKDGINWIHVLNNEGAEKFDAVKAYGVSAFPTKILLDKDGKIIDRYVGEERERFDAKLKELFGR